MQIMDGMDRIHKMDRNRYNGQKRIKWKNISRMDRINKTDKMDKMEKTYLELIECTKGREMHINVYTYTGRTEW